MTELKLRKSKPRAKTNTPRKKVRQNIASLDAYSSTKALNSSLMNTVKTLYKSRDITNIRTAKSALDLLASNNKSDLNKCSKKFSTIMSQTAKKDAKKQVKRKAVALKEEEEEQKIITVVERKIFKPKVNIKHGDTEAPSFEIEFVKKYRIFDEAFDAGVKRLIKLTENHMKTKPNIKLSIGFKYSVIKIAIDADAPSFEEVTEVTTTGKQGICSTKLVEIYNVESVKPTI